MRYEELTGPARISPHNPMSPRVHVVQEELRSEGKEEENLNFRGRARFATCHRHSEDDVEFSRETPVPFPKEEPVD